MDKIKMNMSHERYKEFLRKKLSKKYDFFDLEFIKFAYLMPCKNIDSVLKMPKARFKNILDGIYSDKRLYKSRKEAIYKALKLFFANLVAKDGELIISLSMIDYTKDGIYNGVIPLVCLRMILDRMLEMGYIEVEKGKYYKKNTVVYAKRKFWEDFGELENLKLQVRQLSHVTGYAEERGEKFHNIVSTVEKQENELAKHTVTVSFNNQSQTVKDKYQSSYQENVSLGETMFRRSFLGEGKGGRLYARGKGGIYQRMPSELRKCLKIDDEETIEIDFKCEHLNLLYAKEGHDMWKVMKDAYTVDGIDKEYRFIVKVAVLIMLNCKENSNLFNVLFTHFNGDKEKWRREIFFDKFLKEYSSKEKFDSFINKIKAKHQLISKYFCSGIGLELQRKDSDIMANILEKCLEEGIIALPVHDSVIVKKKHLDKVKKIMEQSFNEVTGFNAIVEI